MEWIVVIVVLLALALVFYMIRENQRDKKKFERELNEDYRKDPDLNEDSEY